MNKIILNKDGKWYHVYEWSAWLLKTVVCTEEMQQARGDAKPLAVSHCNTKTGDYVMAGFPLESVAKYIPEYTDMKEMEDGDLCIGIALPRRVGCTHTRRDDISLRGMEAGTAAEGEPQERAADHVGRHEARSTGPQWRVRYHRGVELSRGAEDTRRRTSSSYHK